MVGRKTPKWHLTIRTVQKYSRLSGQFPDLYQYSNDQHFCKRGPPPIKALLYHSRCPIKPQCCTETNENTIFANIPLLIWSDFISETLHPVKMWETVFGRHMINAQERVIAPSHNFVGGIKEKKDYLFLALMMVMAWCWWWWRWWREWRRWRWWWWWRWWWEERLSLERQLVLAWEVNHAL